MPTRNINLTPEQDAFVERVVESGEYQNASEALRDALLALQHRRQEDRLELKILRGQIDVGIAALARGDFVDMDDCDLERWVSSLAAPKRRVKRALPMEYRV